MKVAHLGLGNMGSGIAENILAAGFDLIVWNRTQRKTDKLADLGARVAKSVAEAVSGVDVVVTSLMDDTSILEIVNGDDGILANMKSGATHVCVTTISPDLANTLLDMHIANHVEFVACLVLGRPDAAQEGSLIGLTAGSDSGLKAATSVIESFTSVAIPIGSNPGHAATMKLCLNYMVISSIELMGEVYACAEKAGLDLEQMAGFFKILFGFPVLHMYADKLKDRIFDDGGFSMTGGLKDVSLMLATAQKLGVQFDIGEIVKDKMNEAIAKGHQDRDWSAIYEVTRARASLD